MAHGRTYVPTRYHQLGESWLLEWMPSQPGSTGPTACLVPQSSSRHVMLSRAQMDALLTARPPAEPALFIFHVSHCGSTLLARLLSLDPSLRVCVEPDYLGRFLAQTYGLSSTRFSRDAPAMIRACGLGAGEGQRVVIKFASHALHRLRAIRECFPHVPTVLVYRHPLEVLSASSAKTWGFLRRRPRWLIELLGPGHGDAASMTAEEISTAYLDGLFRRSVEGMDSFDRVIDYAELPGVLQEIRAGLLGLPEPMSDVLVRDVAGRHSKEAGRSFSIAADGDSHPPSEFVRMAAARWLMPQYDALESRRLAGAGSGRARLT